LEALAAFRKAALYRSPPPDPLIRTRALELAIAIAEENGLIDSARYYTEQLLRFCDSSQKEALALNLKRLEATELCASYFVLVLSNPFRFYFNITPFEFL